MTDDTPRYYTDPNHIVESLIHASNDIDEAGDEAEVTLLLTDAVVICEDWERLSERNLHDYVERVATFTITSSPGLELVVHEHWVEGPLELWPAGPDAIDAKQATQPAELCAEPLASAVREIDDEFDNVRWDLSRVNAASIAHAGHLTDFEFTYKGTHELPCHDVPDIAIDL